MHCSQWRFIVCAPFVCSALVLHFLVLHFPPSDTLVLHFPVLHFPPTDIWSSIFSPAFSSLWYFFGPPFSSPAFSVSPSVTDDRWQSLHQIRYGAAVSIRENRFYEKHTEAPKRRTGYIRFMCMLNHCLDWVTVAGSRSVACTVLVCHAWMHPWSYRPVITLLQTQR